jgi:hypothetical protein
MVLVNNYTRRSFIGSPLGIVKGSGYGREYAEETMREFVRAKNIRFPVGRGVVSGLDENADMEDAAAFTSFQEVSGP